MRSATLIISLLLLHGVGMLAVGKTQSIAEWKQSAIEFKKRILVVEIEEEYVKSSNRNAEEMTDAIYENRAYNKLMREVFREHWSLNDSMIFKTVDEVDSLLKTDNASIAVIRLEFDAPQYYNQNVSYQSHDSRTTHAYFRSYLPAKAKRDRIQLYQVRVNALNHQSRDELIYMVKRHHLTLNNLVAGVYDNKKPKAPLSEFNYKMLATKTLLIPDEFTELSESELRADYQYPFQLVSKHYITHAAYTDKTINCAYLYYPGGAAAFAMVIDAQSGEVLAQVFHPIKKGQLIKVRELIEGN